MPSVYFKKKTNSLAGGFEARNTDKELKVIVRKDVKALEFFCCCFSFRRLISGLVMLLLRRAE